MLDTPPIPPNDNVDLLSSKFSINLSFEDTSEIPKEIDENTQFLENITSEVKNLFNNEGVEANMKLVQVLQTENIRSETAVMILRE